MIERTLISREAARLDGIYFYSRDFFNFETLLSDGYDKKGLKLGLFLIGARALAQKDGDEVSVTTDDVSLDNVSNGSWRIDIKIDHIPQDPAATPTSLSHLQEEELKSALSEMANTTPKTLYIGQDFGEDVTSKKIPGELSPLGMGALMVANALTTTQVGESFIHTFFICYIGTTEMGEVSVCATRTG